MKRTTLITFGLSIAACTSSSQTSPATPADYDDAAQTISSSIVTGGTSRGGDLAAMADASSIAMGRLPLGFLLGSDGRIHGNRLGVDNSFMVTCKNAAGAVLTTCDRTTDSATVSIKQSGNLQTPNLTASVDREGMWTITGLQSATATFNGDSSFSLDTMLTSIFREGVTASFMFDATASYKAITIATQEREITGGSASFDIKAHRTVSGTGSNDVDKSFEVHAEITFHSDHTATLVLDGTHTFTIDLATGKVTKVS